MVDVFYRDQVKRLSLSERLRLVQMIMADIADAIPRWNVDSADEWSDDDLSDLRRASAVYLNRTFKDDDDAAYDIASR